MTKLVAAVPSVRGFLRDRLNLVSTLTQLLCGLSATNNAKTSKVLELLKFVSFGIQVTRQEAYLHDLIPKLLGYACSCQVIVISCVKKQIFTKKVFHVLALGLNGYS